MRYASSKYEVHRAIFDPESPRPLLDRYRHRHKDDSYMYGEWAPPLRIVAVITLFASTLDLFADFLMCHKLGSLLNHFYSSHAIAATYCFFVFTGISVLVYIFEMVDVCLTLKNDIENIFYARLAKSMVLALEEVPLPLCLLIIWAHEPRMSLAQPCLIASCVKLIALTWGIVKFAKLKFCWFCLPITQSHGRRENVRRCFTFTPYRIAMLVVNIAHIVSIGLVTTNIILSSEGGQIILPPERRGE